MTKTELNKNTMTCRRIAKELEEAASNNLYKCPYCGEIHNIEEYEKSMYENEDGYEVYTCPNCDEEIGVNELECFDLIEYFQDCLDIEYTIGSDKKYRHVCIMVTCGGPNIYIDTGDKKVKLYWWTDYAEWYIDNDTCSAIDDLFSEMFSW